MHDQHRKAYSLSCCRSTEEVREVKVNYSFEEVVTPEDAKTVDGGNVQPKEVSQSGLSKLAEKGAGLSSVKVKVYCRAQ